MDFRPNLERKRKVREDKKPACDACRAQKLRCDASADYSRPCTRCYRKQAVCVVQEQRQKKIRPNSSTEAPPLRMSRQTAIVPMEPPSSSATITIAEPTTLKARDSTSASGDNGFFTPTSLNDLTATEAQTIGSIRVEATKLDIYFARFFRYFAPLVPILSSTSTPNETFRESPFKFWVITAIGSRKCLEDPTLFSTLSPYVEALALQSLCVGQLSPYPIVEAYILMCTFQLSTDRPFWRSIYFMLSSATIAITLQAGMHPCLSIQGVFAPARNTEIERGVKLWAYAIISNQWTMSLQGFPITDRLAARHLLWDRACCTTLPSWLALEGRITAHIAELHQMVADIETTKDAKSYSRALKSRISACESGLCDIQRNVRVEDQGPLSVCLIAIARMQIQSFSFITAPSRLEPTDVFQLAEAAIETIEHVSDLDQKHQISLACPQSVFHGIQLAGCTILKLLKSYAVESAYHEKDLTTALFSAINLCKAISVVNNDIPAKMAEILGHLWSSANVYRDADGVHVLPLKVGNRQAMNVVFDSIYWWKKLFVGDVNPLPSNQEFDTSQSAISDHALQGEPDPNQFLLEWESWDFDWDTSTSLQIPTLVDGRANAGSGSDACPT